MTATIGSACVAEVLPFPIAVYKHRVRYSANDKSQCILLNLNRFYYFFSYSIFILNLVSYSLAALVLVLMFEYGHWYVFKHI